MEKYSLKTTKRELNPDALKQLALAGAIPAELYGHGVANLHLAVQKNEFERLLRQAGESTIIQLTAPDGTVHNVLIQDVQNHYLTNTPIHVDFYEVKMTEKLKATIALEFLGESKAVKEAGGTLVKVLNEVEVECLPADLPHNIEVDISILKSFEDSILVKNLALSDKVTILTDPDEVVAKVQPPRDVEAELAVPVEAMDVNLVEGVADKPTEIAADEEAVKE